jgi:hypothetical protein
MDSIFLWWIFCAIVGGAIGAIKGRVGAGILWGALLGPIGVLAACCLTNQKQIDKKTTKKCPYCAERIQKGAKICKFCQKGVETIGCPSCKAKLYRPEGASGSTCNCPSCSNPFILP